MQKLFILTKKELISYFASPVAYIVIGVFYLLVAGFFNKDLFYLNQASFRNILELIPLALVILVPAVTMGTWSEEKRIGTLENLMTLPVTKIEILLSKLLADFIVVLVTIFSTLPLVVVLNALGNPDNGIIFTGYFSLGLLAATYVLIGNLISINTNNQIVAFILSVAVIAFFYGIGDPLVLELLPQAARGYFEAISLSSHFDSIARGVIDSRDLVYYFSVAAVLFVMLKVRLLRISKVGK